MDDVELTLLRHLAGDYDARLGQLCMRCGAVLDDGMVDTPGGPRPCGFPPGEAVLMSITGGLRILESALRRDRDRSDEADCTSVVDGG